MNTKNSLTLTKRYKTALSTIHTVYRLINSTYDTKELILRLAKLICQVLDTNYCLVGLLDHAKSNLLIQAVVGPRKKYLIEKKVRITNGIKKRLIKTGCCQKEQYLLAVPLIGEDTMGLIIVKRDPRKSKIFDSLDQEILMTLSSQAVMAIKNLQLYEEQQKIILGSLKSIVTLLNARVPSTCTHTPTFSKLVLSIAKKMHLDEHQLRGLEYASTLHDTGKVDTPLEILTKPTKLTQHELKIIKMHPVKGAQILKTVQFLKPAIPIIMHHHEKYDGTGYPSGLKKGQIPLGSRIMSVADAFEAMVYGRPYKEKISVSNAIEEIKRKSGSQFDPVVVEAFLHTIKKLKKYLNL